MQHKTQPFARKRQQDNIESIGVPGIHATPELYKHTSEVKIADRAFSVALAKSQPLADLVGMFEASRARYCVFGGWLRDTLASNAFATALPRDVSDVSTYGTDLRY